MDADIQKEYARQREHLERSVASLRKKLVKDTEIHRADNVRIMQVCNGMGFRRGLCCEGSEEGLNDWGGFPEEETGEGH